MKILRCVLMVVALVGTACSGSSATAPTDFGAVDTASDAGVTDAGFTVEPGAPLGTARGELAPGEVKLWVSNQSFTDERVGVTVMIDGTVAIDDWFDVEGQHNWISFDVLGLDVGAHTLAAESTTGAVLETEFVVTDTEPRWLLLDYWNSPDDPKRFTFDEFDEQILFN